MHESNPPDCLLALLLLLLLPCAAWAAGEQGFCSAPPSVAGPGSKSLYWKATNPTLSPAHLEDLPGFTRSVYKRDHALITPESHVFSPLPDWINTVGAYLISPAMGSHFTMYLAKMQMDSRSALPPADVERFLFVIQGTATLSNSSGVIHKLHVDSYAYLPANLDHVLECDTTASLVIFERRYVIHDNQYPEQIIGSTDKQVLLETPGEVFELRKLLPTSASYDFNIHIMDFQPGEYLNVKEVHYNQHGLLLLEGQGIYRLGDNCGDTNGNYSIPGKPICQFPCYLASQQEQLIDYPYLCLKNIVLTRRYPVQAGDAIWMAPFVPQWYAALGKTRSRYLLYKDVNRNPL